MVFCSVWSAVRAASFWVGSVSSMVIESVPVVMMLPMPFWLASIERASRRSSLMRSAMMPSRLT